MSESRRALCRLLSLLGGRFEDCGAPLVRQGMPKFNWELGHSRNPRAPNAQNRKFGDQQHTAAATAAARSQQTTTTAMGTDGEC